MRVQDNPHCTACCVRISTSTYVPLPSSPLPPVSGFAINLSFLLSHPNAQIDPSVQRGYLESSLLSQLVTVDQLEPKADMCTQVGEYPSS